MKIRNAQFIRFGSDEAIRVEIDGETKFVPKDESNRDYRRIVAAGVVIAPHQPPAQSLGLAIEAEAQRRIDMLVSPLKRERARIVADELREKPVLTPAETQRLAAIRSVWRTMKQIIGHAEDMQSAVAADTPIDVATGAIDGDGTWPE